MKHSVATFYSLRSAQHLLISSACMTLVGCSAPLVKSAITSNIVQEETHNAYLLLNIARAHERMPMHFSEVSSVRAAPGGLGIGTPSFGLQIPFGEGPTAKPVFSPSVEASSSVDTKSLVSQDFTRGIMTPVDTKLMVYFANQSWPHAMVLHMFVGSIEVLDKDGKLVYSIHNSPFADTFPWFAYVARELAKCQPYLIQGETPSYYGPAIRGNGLRDGMDKVAAMKEAGYSLVPVDAQGELVAREDEARLAMKPDDAFYRFASFKAEEHLAFIRADRPPSPTLMKAESCEIAQPDTNDPLNRISGSTSQLTTLPEVVQKINEQNRAAFALKPTMRVTPGMNVRFVMRSTQSMIYFLGELSRQYEETERLLTIPVRSGRPAALFATKCCEKSPDAAVSVQYRSRHYSVGQSLVGAARKPVSFSGPDHATEDRSVQTLALVSLVYGLQNQSGEAPTIRNVRVIP